MTLAAGTVEYTLGTAPVTGCGLSWTVEELDIALAGAVGMVLAVIIGLSTLAFEDAAR